MPLIREDATPPKPMRPDAEASRLEAEALAAESVRQWDDAERLWKMASRRWRRLRDASRAGWSLMQAGRCTLESNPEYRRMKAAGMIGQHRPW